MSWRLVILLATLLLGVMAGGFMLLRSERPRTPLWFGLSEPGTVDAQRAAALTGARPTVLNVFVKLDSQHFDAAALNRLADGGITPMVTIEPWSWRDGWGEADLPQYTLDSLASGRHDEALRRIASVVAGFRRPVLVRFAHEMNGWWYPWAQSRNGNQPGSYVHAWRHVHDLFAATGAGNARWVWSPNALTGSGRETALADLYPGASYVDYLGVTAYAHGPSATATVDATYRALAALGPQPILLAETGADGPDQAAWITDLGRFLSTHARMQGFVWFTTNRTDHGASGDYSFADSSTSLAAFRGLLSMLSGQGLLAVPQPARSPP